MNRFLLNLTTLLFATPVMATTLPTPVELVLGLAPVEEETPDLVGDGTAEEKSPWTGTIGIGFTASKTSTDTLGLNMNGSLVRQDDLSNWTSSIKYVYNSDDSEVQDNFLVAQTDYDQLWAPESRWNWFLNGSYQFNQTEAYRQRVKGFGGAGYFLSQTDDLRWNIRGGAGSSWDERGSKSGWTPRALLSTVASWNIATGIKLDGTASFEPAFSDVQNYLAVIELKVNVALTMMDNLSMYFTLRDEYNNRPGAGDNYNQIWITLGFAYGF